MNKLLFEFRKVLHEYFNLEDGRAPFKEITESIENGVTFKGSNLWILMFAILIASIGLNVNSTAVVIGAMLISPLMGPIIGIGLGMGIYDFDLIKKSVKNLAIALLISVLVSAIYFYFTPIQDAQSELLARTTPTLWDVLIGLFGGFAGIIAVTRAEKSNAIPGVAIATALMPPICTAGYGLAIGNFNFFFGALYLFFINSVFIAVSSYIIIRYLHFPMKDWVNQKQQRKWKTYIALIALVTAIPSIYLGYGIVKRSWFDSDANKFINEQFDFDDTIIFQKNIDAKAKKIELFLYGNQLKPNEITKLKNRMKMPAYNDLLNAELILHQKLDTSTVIDVNQMRTGIIEDLYHKNEDIIEAKNKELFELDTKLKDYTRIEILHDAISEEIEAQYPSITSCAVNKMVIHNKDTKNDTTLLVYLKSSKRLSTANKKQITSWLKVRTKENNVKLIIE